MRLTQGTFSFLPDLTDAQISAQIEYCLQQGWAVSVEYTDDPHPRHTYWEMFRCVNVETSSAMKSMGLGCFTLTVFVAVIPAWC